MEIRKTVAAYCQACQRFIAVVPVRRFDRVYVPLCTNCVPPVETMYLLPEDVELVELSGVTMEDRKEDNQCTERTQSTL